MAVQLQWGLEQITFSGLKVARDIIHAASTDNIQAKAIQACEGFGATIAICPETRRKIELTVVPTPPSIPVSFLNGFIGYSSGDCMSQLSKSLAGLQFLGLAAALITTIPMSQAGDLVSAMLANSAIDKTLVPSRRQTIDLLKSIEGRCYHAGFAEDCVGWQLLLEKTIGPVVDPNVGAVRTDAQPMRDGVESLVDAFRQLHRVGESHITRLTIRTASAAPWTIAFVKWCLGRPPSVVLEDGTCVLSQEESLVEVIVSQNDPFIFQVHLHSSISSLSTLIETKASRESVGMIGVSSFGRLLLRRLRGGDFATKVIGQLVPFCIHQITQHLVVLGDSMEFGKAASPQQAEEFNIVDAGLHKQRLSPFPGEEAIIEACEDLLGQKYNQNSLQLADGLTVFDLPLVKQYMDILQADCSCTECAGELGSNTVCLEDCFVDLIIDILTTAFLLSLFDRRGSILLRAKITSHLYFNNAFAEAIRGILVNRSAFSCGVSEVLRGALWLIRHDEVAGQNWVMSCNKDQAVWPMVYETMSFSKHGYLRLLWLPGKLHFQNDTYNLVTSKKNTYARRGRQHKKTNNAKLVSEPCNLFSDVTCHWKVTPEENHLEVSILINDSSGKYNSPWIFASPGRALSSIANALLVDECRHRRDAQLKAPDPFCVLLNPFSRGSYSVDSAQEVDESSVSGLIRVIAVDGSETLRIAALGMNRASDSVVLRGDACLDCCIRACRLAGFSFLVL